MAYTYRDLLVEVVNMLMFGDKLSWTRFVPGILLPRDFPVLGLQNETKKDKHLFVF